MTQSRFTRAITETTGEYPEGSPFCPVYQTTTFTFASAAEMESVVSGEQAGALYTRYGSNPSIKAVEKALAGLEDAPAALVFSAGMAAIASTLLALGREGIVAVGELYGGTQGLLENQIPALGIPVHWVDRGDEPALADALSEPGRLVYCESPTNPTLSLIDLQALATTTHAADALLAVDNTFATPCNQQPLALGADLALHSATKYLGGHSDITAGAVMGPEPLVQQINPWRINLGQLISPDTAALLSRSLRTLPLRMERHNQNAEHIAHAMRNTPGIRRVFYPGLNGTDDAVLAQSQMHGGGGMVTIEVDGDRQAAASVADQLRLFRLAPSLGGVESLVSQPCATSHHGLTPEQREARGITDSMLRLSVGLEDPEDLTADLQRALHGYRS